MSLLYNAGISLFGGALRLAAMRSPKIRKMLTGQADTLATLGDTRRRVAPDGFDVWFHAASLGEFEQGRPMIERLRRERPELKILLTFFSPSGYTVRRDYDKVDAVCYLPLDRRRDVARFLDAASPRLSIFIKYEFWSNYLEALRRRGVPTYTISAIFRPGQRFFRRGGAMFRRALGCFTHLYVQDENSRQLLAGIGLHNVTVAGDTRFDRVTDIRRMARQLPAVLERFVKDSPFTLVAGSSWEPDEELIFPWLRRHPDARLLLAPHEFDAMRLEQIIGRLGPDACLLSELEAGKPLPAGCRAIVIDSFGLLSSLYRVASAAYVGGGFGVGIHNINEAAVYGIPVVFGPHHAKFREATDLMAAGGGFEVTDAASLNAVLDRLASDSAYRGDAGTSAGEYIARNIGATDIIYNDLFKKQ